jgi:hypothetical protein
VAKEQAQHQALAVLAVQRQIVVAVPAVLVLQAAALTALRDSVAVVRQQQQPKHDR